jgi:two-component SAPR family response regulator
MPKMNGFELCQRINKIDNKIKVCFMSAFESYSKEFETAFPNQSENYFTGGVLSLLL